MPKEPPTRALFIAGFGPIVSDPTASRALYRDLLAIPFEETEGYLHTNALDGAKSFGLWPLEHAARSCFGTPEWPRSVPVPQAWIEFDVANVAAATKAFEARGYRPLVAARTEPWGQTVTRLLGPEGLLVGLTYTPWMRPVPPRAGRKDKRA
jgi:hypothetical protein